MKEELTFSSKDIFFFFSFQKKNSGKLLKDTNYIITYASVAKRFLP